MRTISLFILFTVFLLGSCSSQAQQDNLKNNVSNTDSTHRVVNQDFPEPIGYVNDYVSVLDSLSIHRLEIKLDNYAKQTTNQMVIVALDSDKLTEENFDKYSLDLSNYWRVGTKEKDNGLTIVFSPRLRKIRINTGLGTERILTDDICKRILQSHIIPAFKSGDYFGGLDKATDEFIRLWK